LICFHAATSVVYAQNNISYFAWPLHNGQDGHSFPVHVFYPDPVPSDPMPIMVFVHGYLGTWTDYPYIWNSLVPHGVVVALTGSLDGSPAIEPRGLGSDESAAQVTEVGKVPDVPLVVLTAGVPFDGHF